MWAEGNSASPVYKPMGHRLIKDINSLWCYFHIDWRSHTNASHQVCSYACSLRSLRCKGFIISQYSKLFSPVALIVKDASLHWTKSCLPVALFNCFPTLTTQNVLFSSHMAIVSLQKYNPSVPSVLRTPSLFCRLCVLYSFKFLCIGCFSTSYLGDLRFANGLLESMA